MTQPKKKEVPHKQTSMDWRKELDKEFDSASCFCGCYEGDLYDAFPDAMVQLKSFIEKTLETQRREMVAEILKFSARIPKETLSKLLALLQNNLTK